MELTQRSLDYVRIGESDSFVQATDRGSHTAAFTTSKFYIHSGQTTTRTREQ